MREVKKNLRCPIVRERWENWGGGSYYSREEIADLFLPAEFSISFCFLFVCLHLSSNNNATVFFFLFSDYLSGVSFYNINWFFSWSASKTFLFDNLFFTAYKIFDQPQFKNCKNLNVYIKLKAVYKLNQMESGHKDKCDTGDWVQYSWIKVAAHWINSSQIHHFLWDISLLVDNCLSFQF